MAVLQKIRNRGILLVSAIAIALFLFVIGDLLRGGEGLVNQSRQTVGEINGKKVSIQEFQSQLEDFQVYQEITQQRSGSSEEENNQAKDMAWQNFIQNKLVESECAKLGITVTDAEVAEAVQAGASQLLQVPLFQNPQTRQFDYSQVQNFLTEYQKLKEAGTQVPETYEKIYKYYMFAQKQIRNQLLMSKYQSLLSACVLSNPVEAKNNFAQRTTESDILLVSLPFSTVDDKDVNVSDEEIAQRYQKDQERFTTLAESRDIKMIDVAVTASEADRKALEETMKGASQQLAEAGDNTAAGNVTRRETSLLPYTDIYKTLQALPPMIANRLDGDSATIQVGETTVPSYDEMTNTYTTFKLLGKTQQADSVLYRQMAVIATDEKEAATRADSIIGALRAGANFKDIAQKYNQSGDSAWIYSAQFQQSTLDADNTAFVNALYSMQAGETRKLTFTNGNTVILKVDATRHPVTKYNVAAVIRELKFSDDTYSDQYNKFSSFIAANPTFQQIEENAEKNGYTVTPLPNVANSQHNIANISNTRDAIKWIFDEAKVGAVSQLYECGNNDHLLIVSLTDVNKAGVQPLEKVKDNIRTQLLSEKKAEKLMANLSKAKTIDAAKKVTGAVVDTLNHVAFANPTFVPATTSSEPMISALAAKTAKGAISTPVKGNAGVFMLQVLDKTTNEAEKYDAKTEQQQLEASNMRYVGQSILNTLYLKAKVKDQRYKFF